LIQKTADPVTDGIKEVVIDSDGIPDGTNTSDLLLEGVQVELAPNPAAQNVTIKIVSDRNLKAQLNLLSLEGRVLSTESISIRENGNFVNLDISEFSAGFYLLQLRSGDKLITHKLIIE